MNEKAGVLIQKLEDGSKQFYQEGYGLEEKEIHKIHERIMKMGGKDGLQYVEHENLLYILKGKNSKGWETNILKKLKSPTKITVIRFYRLNEDTILKSNTFEFSEKTSELIAKYLPNVNEISVNGMAVSNFMLRNLNSVIKVLLDVPFFKDYKFSLKLPNLQTLEMWYTSIKDPKEWEASFINCPKLEKFYCRKPNYDEASLFTDHQPTFYLPNCLEFTLFVSETLKNIWIYAPRLQKLDLSTSHIDDFKFIENGKEEMKEFNLQNGECPSKFKLKMTSGLFRAQLRNYLKGHPRNEKNNNGSDSTSRSIIDANNNVDPPSKKSKTIDTRDKRARPKAHVERKTISGRVFTF